jgi:hypothetical protein
VKYPCIIALIILFLAGGQAQESLEVYLPSSFPLNATVAYCTNDTGEVRGPISVFNYNGEAYMSIPTGVSEGERLSFFQDGGTGALFRNNTLVLPIMDKGERVANLVLATEGLISINGAFSGRVTGIELDTRALSDGDATASATLYLKKWPDKGLYMITISIDDKAREAVMARASEGGLPGTVRLMLGIREASADSQGSIGYVIVHMKAEECDGNVSAYLYHNGTASRLSCSEIRSGDAVVYETISPGCGIFAFVGPFKEALPPTPGIASIALFVVSVLALQLALAGILIKTIRKLDKRA